MPKSATMSAKIKFKSGQFPEPITNVIIHKI